MHLMHHQSMSTRCGLSVSKNGKIDHEGVPHVFDINEGVTCKECAKNYIGEVEWTIKNHENILKKTQEYLKKAKNNIKTARKIL